MSSCLSKTISKEFFVQQQQQRGGQELYNVSGDRVNVLNSFMEKAEKKRLDRESAKEKVKYAVRVVDELLKDKLDRHQKQRVARSPMSNASKYAKVGDEFNLRVELEGGYPVDSRDGVVSGI